MAKKDFTKFRKDLSEQATTAGRSMYNITSPYRNDPNVKKVEDIPMHLLVAFRGETPFNNYTDTEKFQTLVQNIEEHGIITPIIVRAMEDGKYEVLSGHHRYEAAKALVRATVPAIVYPADTTEEQAMLIHLNTNLMNGRDEMSFLEKVRAMVAYESTLDKLKGKRTDRLENGEKYDRYQHIGEIFKIGSRSTVVKQLKAGKEMPEDILKLIDEGHVSFEVAYKTMVQDDNEFKEELFTFLRQGNALPMSQLESLLDAHKRSMDNDGEPVDISSAFAGFDTLDDVNFEKEELAQTVVETPVEKPKKEKKPLKANNFDDIIKEEKKKKTFTLKMDKTLLPDRFLVMNDEQREEIIVWLLKKWDTAFNEN